MWAVPSELAFPVFRTAYAVSYTHLDVYKRQVFWFDVAGVNDLGNFWAGTGTLGVTGQYMTGFFPVMMFGLPAAALAMYHTAKPGKKKVAYGLLPVSYTHLHRNRQYHDDVHL